jgi:hypothetical protein
MKQFLPFLVLCSSLCFAAETSDITTKVTEVDSDKDGRPNVRAERVFRGKDEVLQTLRTRRKTGVTTTARSYSVAGDLLMIESDGDGDGFFEKIVIFHPMKKDIEVFTRHPDGSVSPVSTEVLKAERKQHDRVTEAVEKLFEKK